VGGIEAEAVLLGQPYYMLLPEVVGVRLSGSLPEGATATDLVLEVTRALREHGVVGRFVEYFGPGMESLSLADRATLANMSPEYGATIGFFPVDAETLRYLTNTGRPAELVDRVERVSKELGLFHSADAPDPEYTSTLSIDLSSIEPSVAGPTRPQDRISLTELRGSFGRDLPNLLPQGFSLDGGSEGGTAVATKTRRTVEIELDGQRMEIGDGSVVVAAITSCTNTSNPSVMVGAGLLARNAVARGMQVKPWVKTSMAPGSKVVTDYLMASGLLPFLEQLRFQVVGYGCTTCIGNSGPLPEPVAEAIREHGLVVSSALSGNRNYEARIHTLIRANYLASPPLVVAFALAGRIDIDLYNEPLGHDNEGKPVFLADLWPSSEEIRDTVTSSLKPSMYVSRYSEVFDGTDEWKALEVPNEGQLYGWEDDSTYIRNPPFFEGMTQDVPEPSNVHGARVLALLGNTVTTDHISPAGAIAKDGPAGQYLLEHGVAQREFNTFGARRGNHEVMMRGTFGNVRIKNQLLDGREGGYTIHFPSGEETSIYEASMRYQADRTPLVVLAGTEYGAGSSRDWAAKGTGLLGVRAVIATSYERIHRSNLVGMGVLPLEFPTGSDAPSLGLTGREVFDITGIETGLRPQGTVHVIARSEGGDVVAEFDATVRLDSLIDVDYYKNGGILHTVLRNMAAGRM